MSKNTERVKESASAPEQFTINTKASRWSQQGRVYRYLKDQGRSEKRELTKKAINAFYLVEALDELGTRSREDLQKVAKRCVDELLTQVDRINRKAGLKIEMNVTALRKLEDDSVELEESNDNQEEEIWIQEGEPLSLQKELTDEEFEDFCNAI
ncbi:MAG: hypothetical protein GVY17_01810 [Cyanobacteria bacterium]|jgi:hypothetical protein|nr:hypothetical protein [Cyanobacteria bacterium GSL.Bin21]